MAKVPINTLLLLSKRSYSVAAAENARVQPVQTTMRNAAEAGGVVAEQKQIFWMRDPKSGNWIPESHFNEIDVAELREKFLSKKEKP